MKLHFCDICKEPAKLGTPSDKSLREIRITMPVQPGEAEDVEGFMQANMPEVCATCRVALARALRGVIDERFKDNPEGHPR